MHESSVIRKERTIHFPGEVLVSEGERVGADTIVAEGVYNPTRLFFVEAAKALRIAPSEMGAYVLKRKGDEVAEGEILAERRVSRTETLTRKSPVDGVVDRVSLTSGHFIIAEGQVDLCPRKVNVAQELGLESAEASRYMKKKVGELVEKGGTIAELPLLAGFRLRRCKSPIYGKITSANRETGEVVVQRPYEHIELKAGLPGIVEEIVSKRGVIIGTEGHRIQGTIGFGKEAFGMLRSTERTGDDLGGCILVSRNRLSGKEIEELRGRGVKGVVLSELNVDDVEGLFGEEVYSGVTGSFDKGIVLLILNGFGEQPMDGKNWDFFRSVDGSPAYLNGMTQIRAGVVRPELIICSDG